jgi:hypothetical protein
MPVETGEPTAPVEGLTNTPTPPTNVNIGLPNFLQVPIYTDVLAVYNPIVYHLSQPVYPYDGTLKTVTYMRVVNQSETGFYGLGGNEVYVELSAALNFPAKNSKLNFTTGTLYKGLYRIKVTVSPSKFIIDTAFIGSETGNLVGKYLENFKVLTKIVKGTDEHTMYAYPDEANKFYFDIAPYCSTLLAHKLLDAVPTALLTRDENNIGLFVITHAWQYIDYDGNGLQYRKESSFGSLHSIHAVNTHLQYVVSEQLQITDSTLTLNDFVAVYNSAFPAKFLTFSPRTINISEDESYQLSFYKAAFPTAVNWVVQVDYYDSDGVYISNETETLPYSNDKQLWVISCGMSYLTVPANCSYYNVYIETETESANPMITETFRFNVKDKCGDSVRILWQNKMLGIDGFTFNGKISRNEKTSRKESKRRMNNLRTIGEKEWNTYSINTSVEYTINSGLVNRVTREWLREILSSTNLWWEINSEDGEVLRLPIRITSDNFSSIDTNDEAIHNIVYTFSMAYDEVNRNG